MAGKRHATSDLNHDNWDREEEPEERGTFRAATEEELKNRVIKKARRKISPSTGNDTADGSSSTKSIFSGFSGFGKPSADTPAATSSSPFSFLSKIPAVATTTSDVSSSTTTTNARPTFSFGNSSATAKSNKSPETSYQTGNSAISKASLTARTSSAKVSESSELSQYYMKLSSLNQAVCEWIKTHVDKNPVCILSPIFRDYEKYLESIENTRIKEDKEEANNTEEKSSSVTSMKSFKFSLSSSMNADSVNPSGSKSTTIDTDAKTNGFSFELKKPENISSVKPPTTTGFSFALNPPSALTATATSTYTPSSNFSFGNLPANTSQPSKPQNTLSTPGGVQFSFGNIKPPDVVSGTSASGDDPNEEDEEPPKNEFKQVVEEGAIYSKKCKVFVKKDGSFVEKGVGTLYLKPIESSDKTQLLVRADTNLGNILVNLILNSSIPAQRMGKNNVMMICMPTPDVEKPTSMLIRVKTAEEADELLKNIDKYKK